MKDIVDIVEDEIIEKMDNTINVLSFVGDTLTVCDLKWSRPNLNAEDSSGNTYKITSVDYDNSTLVISPNGAYTFSGNQLKITSPVFFVGTPISTNKEWGNFNKDERKKLPLAWLLEPIPEIFNSDESPIERDSEIMFIFLDSNNVAQWRTRQTHKERLRGLYNMVDVFIDTIKENGLFHSSEMQYKTKNFTKFGKETSHGVETNIIDANLTGVEVKLTLSVRRTYGCNC